MDKFLNLLVSGGVSGAIYSLVASGLALTYATTRVFNLGFGGVAFAAAFTYYELHAGLHWSVLVAAVVTLIVIGPVLGWILNKLILGRLSTATDAAKVMAAVGILIALPALARWSVEVLVNVFHAKLPLGDQIFAMPGIGPSPVKVWHPISGLTLTSDQVIVFCVAAVLAVALWALLRHTRLGLQMRAATDRPELAALRGINNGAATASAWIIGTTLACIAGLVGAPILNTLDPNAYATIVFVATAAVVLGGFRSVPLAFAGGLALGILQNLVAGYATFASNIHGFNTSVPFLALLLGLVFLSGRKQGRSAGSVAEDAGQVETDTATPLRRALTWAVPSILLLAYMLFVADAYWLTVLITGLALAIVSLSYVVVTGLGGMVSLAQAAFVTAAGLTVGVAVDRFQLPWPVAFVMGTAVAAVLGAVVALPALRVSGLALSLSTLALAFLGDSLLFQWNFLRGGDAGWEVNRPKLGPLDLGNDKVYAVALFVVMLIVTLLISNLSRSSSGRQMFALRASEPAAASSGISPTMVKLRLFTISAAIAGAGGVLLITADQHATNVTYVTQVGLVWLASAVLMGVSRPRGAIVAGMFAAIFPAVLSNGLHLGPLSWGGTSSTWLPQLLFGLGAIAMAQHPHGLLGGPALRRRTRPTTASTAQTAPIAASDPALTVSVPPGRAAVPPSDSADVRLQLAGVRSGYGGHDVLTDVHLNLGTGTITALVGANGAGKSTLCKTVAGLLRPTAGTITLDGTDLTKRPTHHRASSVLLAPEARGVFPSLSVEDNLNVLLRTSSERDEVYDRFPVLGERRRIAAGSLSGGEQQILTMAPILLRPPPVLIADEPTLGLAPRIVEQLLELFHQLREGGTTILLSEERARVVIDIADQVALLEVGRVIWAGPRAELGDDQLTAIYLGSAHDAEAATESLLDPAERVDPVR